MSGVKPIGEVLGQVVRGILDGMARDDEARGQFTQDVVRKLHDENPHFNYVICHTKHETAFDGERGKDWGHYHQEFDIKIGGTIGYEIYWFKSGKFIRKGDGGYLNWAYYGKVISKSSDGKEVVFAAP